MKYWAYYLNKCNKLLNKRFRGMYSRVDFFRFTFLELSTGFIRFKVQNIKFNKQHNKSNELAY